MHPLASPLDHITHAATIAAGQGTDLLSATYTPELPLLNQRAGVWATTQATDYYGQPTYRVAFISYGDTEFGSATYRGSSHLEAAQALCDRTVRAATDQTIHDQMQANRS